MRRISMAGANIVRYGYPVNVITRQKMLEVLYDGLRESTNVLGGKRVTGIYHKESGVAVHTAGGGVYKGDLVVGADGVKSIARLDMLQAAGKSAMKEAASIYSSIYQGKDANASV